MRELRRCYALAHNNKMAWADAGCAARILRELRYCIEGSNLEQRIAALEADAEHDQPRRTNGQGWPEARLLSADAFSCRLREAQRRERAEHQLRKRAERRLRRRLALAEQHLPL